LKKLVDKTHLTPEGWLYIKVDTAKINEAINMLSRNKGASAKLDAGHGVKIQLTIA
jgi:hypothetical protein